MLYLAVDGGGTKLVVLLFDEKLHLISHAETGGTNTNFRPEEDVRRDINKALDECLGASHPVIENVVGVTVGGMKILNKVLAEHAEIKNFSLSGEAAISIPAGTGEKYGVLALSGTGSGVQALQPNWQDYVGGWGMNIGDEASGYDIGVKAIRAAIYGLDGRGISTSLTALLMEEWKLSKLWDCIERIRSSPDPRRLIASVTKIVSHAADGGDETAIRLYREAGLEMAYMAKILLSRRDGIWIGPIVASGGVWKGSRLMFDTFTASIHETYPAAEVTLPVFDPVIGGVVLQAFANGMKKEDFWENLKPLFRDYLYFKDVKK